MSLVGLIAASIWLGKQATSDQEISRREFLKTLGTAVAFGYLAGIVGFFSDLFIQRSSGVSTRTEERDMWLTVSDIVQPRLFGRPIVDGRTAMGINKKIDSLSNKFYG